MQIRRTAEKKYTEVFEEQRIKEKKREKNKKKQLSMYCGEHREHGDMKENQARDDLSEVSPEIDFNQLEDMQVVDEIYDDSADECENLCDEKGGQRHDRGLKRKRSASPNKRGKRLPFAHNRSRTPTEKVRPTGSKRGYIGHGQERGQTWKGHGRSRHVQESRRNKQPDNHRGGGRTGNLPSVGKKTGGVRRGISSGMAKPRSSMTNDRRYTTVDRLKQVYSVTYVSQSHRTIRERGRPRIIDHRKGDHLQKDHCISNRERTETFTEIQQRQTHDYSDRRTSHSHPEADKMSKNRNYFRDGIENITVGPTLYTANIRDAEANTSRQSCSSVENEIVDIILQSRKNTVVLEELHHILNNNYCRLQTLQELEDILRKHKAIFSPRFYKGAKYISLKTYIRICGDYTKTRKQPPACTNQGCSGLHICKFNFIGKCQLSNCKFEHNLDSRHNAVVRANYGLLFTSGEQIRQIARQLQNRNKSTLPTICKYYQNYSGCNPKGGNCKYLHICKFYVQGNCTKRNMCERSHNILDSESCRLLNTYGLDVSNCDPNELIEVLRVSIDDSPTVTMGTKQTKEKCSDALTLSTKHSKSDEDGKVSETKQRSFKQNWTTDAMINRTLDVASTNKYIIECIKEIRKESEPPVQEQSTTTNDEYKLPHSRPVSPNVVSLVIDETNKPDKRKIILELEEGELTPDEDEELSHEYVSKLISNVSRTVVETHTSGSTTKTNTIPGYSSNAEPLHVHVALETPKQKLASSTQETTLQEQTEHNSVTLHDKMSPCALDTGSMCDVDNPVCESHTTTSDAARVQISPAKRLSAWTKLGKKLSPKRTADFIPLDGSVPIF
mgnify:FL=1